MLGRDYVWPIVDYMVQHHRPVMTFQLVVVDRLDICVCECAING